MKASTKQDSSSELSLLGLFPYYCGVLTEILIFHKNVRFPSSSPTLNSTSVDPDFKIVHLYLYIGPLIDPFQFFTILAFLSFVC